MIESVVTLAAGVELVIEPGAIVKLKRGSQLVINGALNAEGLVDNKIIFTSYEDDSSGGDTNADGYSIGRPGDWKYIVFNDTAPDSLTTFSHVEVRFAGSSGQSIYLNAADITLDNVLVEESQGYGLYVTNSAAVISSSTVRDNGNHGIYLSHGGAPLIENSVISDNRGAGIYSQYGTPEIVGNTIENNDSWGVYFSNAYTISDLKDNTIRHNARPVRIPVSGLDGASGNIFAPNDIDGLFVIGGTATSGLSLSLEQYEDGSELNTYVITADMTIPTGQVFTVDAGVTTKFYPGTELRISGEFQSLATEQSPAVFTAYRDDRFGGDTNNDGYNSTPYNGYWDGIRFYDSAVDHASTIDHLKIHYAGGTSNGALYFNRTLQALNNVEIAFSGSEGVYCNYYCELAISNSDFYGNTDGIEVNYYSSVEINGGRIYANRDDGIDVRSNSSVSTSTGFEVFGNSANAVRSDVAVSLDNVWWGAEDGPSGAGSGSGDSITANVSYADVRSSGTGFLYFNAGANTTNGTFGVVDVLSGTATSEWGSSAAQQSLYGFENIELAVSGLNDTHRYQLISTLHNPDETASSGGNIQRLEDIDSTPLEPRVKLDDALLSSEFWVPESSISEGILTLRWVKENGYRAVISQLWMLAEPIPAGNDLTVTVASPANGETVGTETTLSGSVTASSVIDRAYLTITAPSGTVELQPLDSIRDDGTWTFRWQPQTSGNYAIALHAEAADGQSASTGIYSYDVDLEKPASVSNFYAYDTPEDNGGSISLLWSRSSSTDVVTYQVHRSLTGNDGSYTLLASFGAEINNYSDTDAVTGTSYYYRLDAVDGVGFSASAHYGPVVAFDNTLPDSAAPEDVSGLTAIAGDGSVSLAWDLSENTAGDQVDQWLDISTDGGVSWGTNSPSFDNGAHQSLGLLKNQILVEDLTNGQGYQFRIRTADGASPVNISSGAISAEVIPAANAVVEVSGSLTRSTRWSSGVYHVTSNLTIDAGVTLRVDPGVVIKFSPRTTLTVNGTLDVQGNDGERVTFTAYEDDSVGGDTNNDGASAGERSSWGYIRVNASGSVSLNYADIHYAGYGSQYSLYVYQTDADINSSRIAHGYGGVYLYQSSGSLSNNEIYDHDQSGLKVYSGTSTIAQVEMFGNHIHNNAHGVTTSYANVDFYIEDNVIENNSGTGLDIYSGINVVSFRGNEITNNNLAVRIPFAALPDKSDNNILTPNTRPVIEVLAGSLSRSVIFDPTVAGALYITDNATVASGGQLVLKPGSVVKFTSSGQLTNSGALSVQGEADNRVVFTSYRDDTIGGDSNGNGLSRGQPGDWKHLYFGDSTTDSLSTLAHTEVRFAGSSGQSIYLNGADITLDNVLVEESQGYGLYLTNSAAVISNSTVRDNGNHGIYLSSGSTPLIETSVISDNRGAGIYSQYGTPEIVGNTIENNDSWGVYFSNA
ncbi:MAG: right-handed parallel beta-helix repeat-containing protein, partial [Pseudomonadota bacterium]|nr:right-handed parallel beta-helix repeat-containing protein [Pseudomonadota bacterium]